MSEDTQLISLDWNAGGPAVELACLTIGRHCYLVITCLQANRVLPEGAPQLLSLLTTQILDSLLFSIFSLDFP